MITVPNAFTPTHRHKSGDEYEVIHDEALLRSDNGEWIHCKIYRNKEGFIAVRTDVNFAESFTKIPDDPARTTFSKVACPECGGSGWGPDVAYGPIITQEKCTGCDGKGQVLKSSISKAFERSLRAQPDGKLEGEE